MSFEVLLIVILALIFLLQWLDGLDRDRRKAREAAEKAAVASANMLALRKSLADLLKKLQADPNNIELQNKVLASMSVQEDSKDTGAAYSLVLSLLAADPTNSGLKQLVLAAGRTHYGKIAGGVASLDDEQRIMNDISVRSS
jgi:hypothetical protein